MGVSIGIWKALAKGEEQTNKGWSEFTMDPLPSNWGEQVGAHARHRPYTPSIPTGALKYGVDNGNWVWYDMMFQISKYQGKNEEYIQRSGPGWKRISVYGRTEYVFADTSGHSSTPK